MKDQEVNNTIKKEKDEQAVKVEQKADKSRDHLFLAVFFILYSFILFFHLIVNIKTKIAGTWSGNDLLGTFHLYWLWKKFLVYNSHLCFRDGITLSSINQYFGYLFNFAYQAKIYHFLNFIIFRFLEVLMPFPVYYNVAVIASYAINGFCFALLGHYLFKDKLVAAATGIAYSLSLPVIVGYLFGMNEFCWTFPIPLYFLYLFKLFNEEDRKWKHALLAGLFFGLASWFYWFYGLFLGLISIIFLVYQIYRSIGNSLARRRLLMIPVIMLTAFLMVGPLLYPVYNTHKIALEQGKFGFPRSENSLRVDNISKLPPSERLLADLSASTEHVFRPTGFVMNSSYIPVIILVLTVLSLLFIKKIPGFWYWAAFGCFIMSLGPFLKYNDAVIYPLIKNPLYIWLFEKLPGFINFRKPYRFAFLTEAFMLIIAGYVMAEINRRFKLKKSPARYVLPILFTGILIYLLLPMGVFPLHVSTCRVPSVYTRIGRENRNVRVLHLPFTQIREEHDHYHFGYNRMNCEMHNFYKTFYTEKIRLNGLEPQSDEFGRRFEENSYLQELAAKCRGLDSEDCSVKPEDYSKLIKNNYRYVVVHEGFFRYYGDSGRKKLYNYITSICGEPVDSGWEYFCFPGQNGHKTEIVEERCAYFLYKLPEKASIQVLNGSSEFAHELDKDYENDQFKRF